MIEILHCGQLYTFLVVLSAEELERTPKSHMRVPMKYFLQPRDVSLYAVMLKLKDIHDLDISPKEKEKILEDRNHLNVSISFYISFIYNIGYTNY